MVATAMVLLTVRLFWVQLIWGGELRAHASEIRTKKLILQPHRGNIYDRHHNELVTSLPAYSVYVYPDQISDPATAAEKIASVLNLDSEEVYKKITNSRFFVWIKHGVSFENAETLKKVKGVGFIEGSRRSYKQGGMAAHVLGFVGDENQGLTGIEKSYDKDLSGVPGYLIVESDAQGQKIPQAVVNVCSSRPGHNLVLTIDQTVQYFVERELDRLQEKYQPAQATILVMDPMTGEVLAMGSRPSFSPEQWNQLPQKVWEKNVATLYNYEPGSTLKMFIAAAALEEGIVKPADTFYDPGYIVVNGRRLYCWDRKGHGKQSFVEAVENSCNPVFIQVGMKLGKERLYKYLKGFGFGSPTGIDLPGEEAGLLKPLEKTTDLDIATMSMGHSVAVTPLQLLTGVCAIANGGKLIRPHLVKAIEDEQGRVVRRIEPQVVRQVISEDTARQLSTMLEKVVLEGTGKRAMVEGYRVAGKTGTAQLPGPGGYQEDKYVASFAGFAPLNEPRLAVLVVIAEPKGGEYHGGEVAAPAFQAIVHDTLNYLNLPEEEGLHPSLKEPGHSGESQTRVSVPNVVGFPVEDARWLLEKNGLKVYMPVKQGIVQEQKPVEGSLVRRGTLVSLRVTSVARSGYPQLVRVPDLSGLTIKKAGILMEELGLKLHPEGTGFAVKQDPPAGIRVQPGSTVRVEFSSEKDVEKGDQPSKS